MAKKKRQHKDPLAAAMEYFMWLGKITQDEMAEYAGYQNRNMIAAILGGHSPGSEPKRRAIAAHFGFEYDEFLKIGRKIIDGTFTHSEIRLPPPTMTGTATTISPPAPEPKDAPPPAKVTAISEQHYGVVDRFKNKPRGLRINEMLLRIEELDEEALIKLEGKIETILEQLEESTDKKKTGTQGA
jgi:transcriptional regulator with XRE-family HTH domain